MTGVKRDFLYSDHFFQQPAEQQESAQQTTAQGHTQLSELLEAAVKSRVGGNSKEPGAAQRA